MSEHAGASYQRARGYYRALRGRALAIDDPSMRGGYLRAELSVCPTALAAAALDLLCLDAEQADEGARELLIGVVRLLSDPAFELLATRLRDRASGERLLGLSRLLRQAPQRSGPRSEAEEPEGPVPEYVKGRILTLGERKALARRPDRAAFDKLLRDPHPDVIRNLLRNPRLTEDDVIRLSARRPARGDVMLEISQSPKWSARPRVRMSLVLNPGTPPSISVPMVGLLLRGELELVTEMTAASPLVRAAAHELLQRRPPLLADDDGERGEVQ